MQRDPLRDKSRPERDEAWYRDWCAAHLACQVCGIGARNAAMFRFPGLSTHHIIKSGRAHESCNLLRTCARCHDLAEGRGAVGWLNGVVVRYPRLTIGMCLRAKHRSEPGDWNPERLERLYGQALPIPEALPALLVAEWNDRQRAGPGVDLAWNWLGVQPSRPVRIRPCFLK